MKILRLALLVTLAAVLLSGCSAEVAPVPSPSPSPIISPSASPTTSTTPEILPSDAPSVFIPVGEEATITVNQTKLTGNAYYLTESIMLFPLTETAKALGWTAMEPTTTGTVTVRLNRAGAEEVVLTYANPKSDTEAVIVGATATKGGKAQTLKMEQLAAINGTLYATESFIDTLLQSIAVEYDGATQITIMPTV